MIWPRVSIVIPSFNAACTIERAIVSVLNQNYPNLELIVMDGGSQDGSVEVARKLLNHGMRIISEPDTGQANALNKGFKLATGDIFGWLCADDELTPGALVCVAGLFNERPDANFLTGGCMRVFEDGTTTQTQPNPAFWDRIGFQNAIEQPSTFWKSELHRAAGHLDETFNYAFDWVWWNELKRVGAKPIRTGTVLSRYYFSESNKTATGGRKLVDEMYRVVKKYGPLNGRLADIYMYLYLNFDLRGYFDRPPSCGKIRAKLFNIGLKTFGAIVGKEWVRSYNWNFASRQERRLCWH
jgi:glycosyltransferase involved in cell wall biosynthesis